MAKNKHATPLQRLIILYILHVCVRIRSGKFVCGFRRVCPGRREEDSPLYNNIMVYYNITDVKASAAAPGSVSVFLGGGG